MVDAGWVLAIDFGTSYTVTAVRGERGPEVIEIGGDRRVPSVVLADEDGVLVVGRAAEDMSLTQPGRTMRAPKSRLGEPAPVILAGRPHNVVDFVTAIFRHVHAEAVRHQGSEPSEVRLTHPATWSKT